jgi:hypothetical protein
VLEVLPFARYSILRLLFAFIMFNSVVAFAPRTVVAVVCIGAPSVSLAPAAAATDGMYGSPAAAAKYRQRQSLEDSRSRTTVA